jgi:hypothetical protein
MHVSFSRALVKDKEYVLKFAREGRVETTRGPVNGPFEEGVAEFNTKPTVSIVRPFGKLRDQDGEMNLAMISRIMIDRNSLPKGTLSELLGGVKRPVPAEFSMFDEQGEMFNDRGEINDPRFIGWTHVDVPEPGIRSNDTKLSVGGVTNIFGDPVKVNPKDRFQLQGAPADKASSDVYIKFLNQAGTDAKPGWAADIKLSPSLTDLGKQYYLTPEFLADIGIGKVADAKVADLIKFGLGFTKFYRFRNTGALQGLQLTPRGAIEMNSKGQKRNGILDADSQWFFTGLLNSIKDRNFRKYARLRNSLLDPRDMPDQATWGYRIQFFLGSEIGNRLSEDTVKASSGPDQVVVPTFNVARIRPKMTATLEYKRLTLTWSATPRYLISSEIVTREVKVPDPSDSTKLFTDIFLHSVKNFRPYTESSIAWHLDYDRHYAITVAHKYGSLPPNFDHINTVQTGFVIKF